MAHSISKVAAAITLAVGMAASSSAALAHVHVGYDNPEGMYLGADYGWLRVDGAEEFDEDKDVYQGLMGYRFNSYFAIEGSYIDFGDYGSDMANADTDGFTAAIKGILPLGKNFEIYAKLGQLWSESHYRLGQVRGESDDESLFVGTGISFKLSPRFSINAGYTLYDTTLDAEEAVEDFDDSNFDTDLKQASIGVEFRF